MITRGAARPAGTHGGGGGSAEASVELGRTLYGPDYIERTDAPPTGFLFSGWIRIPEQISTFPYTRGNLTAVDLFIGNWYARCIVGNIGAEGPEQCLYNANSLIFANGTSVGEGGDSWAGDYSFLFDVNRSVEEVNGFVFAAWQIVNTGTVCILRQWVIYSATGHNTGVRETVLTYAQFREALVTIGGWQQENADLWTPDMVPTRFRVGLDDGMFIHLRVEDSDGTLPTDEYIEEIAALQAADPTAWGDWQCNWTEGAANFTDRSGNGRDMAAGPGSEFYQGPNAPWSSGGGGGGSASFGRMPSTAKMRLVSRRPQ